MSIVSRFALNGYSFLDEHELYSFDFALLYSEFDVFIEHISTDLGKSVLKNCLKNCNVVNTLDYMGTLPGFKDKRGISGIEPRVYFWGCPEYVNLMDIEFKKHSIKLDFLVRFLDLHQICYSIFEKTIESLTLNDGGRNYYKLYNIGQFLPIFLRILRYDSSANITSNPHCDKSVLTLNLNSSDTENCFVIGKGVPDDRFTLSSLTSPIKEDQLSTQLYSKPIVYPGLCFKNCFNLNIQASPHAVLRFHNGKHRYASVAFLFLPGEDSKAIDERVKGWNY